MPYNISKPSNSNTKVYENLHSNFDVVWLFATFWLDLIQEENTF